MTNRFSNSLRSIAVFQTPLDYQVLRRLRAGKVPNGMVVELKMRGIRGGPVFCRAGTTDWKVLLETFVGRHHRPPRSLGRGSVILDCGANVGYTIVDLANRFPNSRVIGIEMDPGNAELARRNIARFGDRVRVIEGAVWMNDGEITYAGEREWGFHVRQPGETVNVERRAKSLTISTICESLSIAQVDYIKMDIEGAESEVIGPSATWLMQVGAIKLEVHAPATISGCQRVLESYGFACKRDIAHPSLLVGTRNQGCRLPKRV